ncbi:Uncharacterised protein [Mycobacterium tuberculosis]|nr:Uncharacterised protein [Mycobacterium tuberculosis]COY43479.1 Uncharacterised protein [Mycobacterium tuberculosis]
MAGAPTRAAAAACRFPACTALTNAVVLSANAIAVVIGEPTALRVIASGNPNVITPVKFVVSIEKAMVVSVTVITTLVKFCDMAPGMLRMGNRSPTGPSSRMFDKSLASTPLTKTFTTAPNTSVTAPLTSPAARACKADCRLGGMPASPIAKSLVASVSAVRVSWP